MDEDRVVVIQGSHRRDGDTRTLVDCAFGHLPVTRITLLDLRLEPYSYERVSLDDDFLLVAESMRCAKALVFATPVYWYAMSGLTKTLLDRFTDLITIRKDIGRMFRGKSIYLLACGTDLELPSGFTVPFVRTAEYFEMEFGEALYAQVDLERTFSKEVMLRATAFGQRVLHAAVEPL